ncbi:MAG: tRNA (adenosine(37)-N6)-dimethylallyltransferase MiaA [Fusobacterium sp.]|uniref:tRNA (adenosine(37)-N6)-dimethylallyltransferase MiaA n=1 Tax=Fusobacterium sp. TaxID=68766 RepID=UPI0026DC5FA7|nr:tRNA (adenosine(37)-N6)-dimethylallyltransferase MiaA [Fusobacterium sp.]MDO4691106.1 tRNA (adenosine(37)-N6)-dimethylallyltransferase MiaA [Fusobacterium sp.]
MSTLNKGIVIAGPTGVGKTKISIELAKKLKADIISADSAQVYSGLNIGTAKIAESEKEGIIHHLIDVVDPNSKYSVGNFEKTVSELLNKNKEKPFLLVGGTGLYISSITEGLSQLPSADARIRESLSKQDVQVIYDLLARHDEEAAREIHISNRRRLERALEVYLLTGEKFSVLSRKNVKNNNFSFLKIVLERDRENLYERINKRVEIMFEQGLEEEVRNLYKLYGENLYNLNIIGYKEVIAYIKKEISLERAKYEIKRNSRHYAKRQFTWFKADKDYKWINLDKISEEEAIHRILTFYEEM